MQTEPTDAELGRTLATSVHTGALSTLGRDGFPFGSVVSHALDATGRPLLLLSDLAEHTRNLITDPRASLLVAQQDPGDPLALSRVTLIGEVAQPPQDERADALTAYRTVHQGTLGTDHGFRIYRMEVTAVRFVGGFAHMSWVGTADHAAAEPDPLVPHVARIVEHMNDDHAEALVTFCRTFGERPDTGSAEMTGCDRYGFTVLADGAPLRLPFPRRVDTPDEVRAAMVEMVRAARAATA
ncbi:HugZ family pyridoxamine 5'-phosphate oxidase [Pseudonocardia saturnea]